MTRNTCSACQAPVIWAVTAANQKRIPLNPGPDPDGNQAAYRDGAGGWRTRQLKDGEEPYRHEKRYMPHFAHLHQTGSAARGRGGCPVPVERHPHHRRAVKARRP